MDLQPWGTPEQVVTKTTDFCQLIGADNFVGVFRFGGMGQGVAEASMRLFAAEILPELASWHPSASASAA